MRGCELCILQAKEAPEQEHNVLGILGSNRFVEKRKNS